MVVVLPMVLDSEPRPSGEEISVTIPSPDAGTFSPKIAAETPAPKPTPKPPEPQAKPEPKAAAPAPAPGPEAEKTARAEPPKVPAKPALTPSPKAPSTEYVIQVIALADADKAKQLQEKMAAAGIKSYTEVVKTVKGDVTRVRAGPFTDRKSAEKAQKQLKAIGLTGNISTK